jgi:uncharacterized protein YbbK (DUF523 family)
LDRIRLGISSCLLGNNVRYDGGHKLDAYLRDTLGEFVEYVPVCPEAEAGLGIPREPMRLVDTGDGVRLVTLQTGIDMTKRVRDWSKRRVGELELEGLRGFIFKSKSPSCGMAFVKVCGPDSAPEPVGAGVFATEFMARFPLVPVEDEDSLSDPKTRENFIEAIRKG